MPTKKAIRTAGIIITVLSLLFLFTVYKLLSTSPQNPQGTIGNTAGNLNNSGIFCEKNGTVYFSNRFDQGSLYAMDVSEGNIRKLSNVIACNLLADEHSLYYFQLDTSGGGTFDNVTANHGFNKCNLQGKNPSTLTREVIVKGQLIDNFLYLVAATDNGPLFYKMKPDRSHRTPLANYEINPACSMNSIIYYSDEKDNHFLYALDTAQDTSEEIFSMALWNPIVYGNYVYYMDVANNYRLCRYSFIEEKIEVLTNDRVDCFNVGNGYLYYQKNGVHPQLKCMSVDGKEEIVIAEGIFTHINMTSEYVYFEEFGKEDALYHSAIGSTGYSLFEAAKEGAIHYSSM